jgi:hypothetical protein
MRDVMIYVKPLHCILKNGCSGLTCLGKGFTVTIVVTRAGLNKTSTLFGGLWVMSNLSELQL